MRFWIAGPRMLGGWIRPGVSFGANDFRRRGASAQPAQDYVYVIAGEHGLVKVGMSADPSARLANLQTASPDRLRMAFCAPAYGNAYTVEQEAHRILAANRTSGEWFTVSSDMAVAALYAAADRTGCSLSSEPAIEQVHKRSFLSVLLSNTWIQAEIILFILLWLLGWLDIYNASALAAFFALTCLRA